MKLQRQLYRDYPELDRGIMWLYLTAKQQGIPRFYFPDEYRELESCPLTKAFGYSIPKEWMAQWIRKWPTQSITMLDYAVSGNTAACTKRMKAFVKEFNSVFDVEYSTDRVLEIIDDATDRYLEQQEERFWEMTKKNSKFIKDINGSVLEEYCRKVIENEY